MRRAQDERQQRAGRQPEQQRRRGPAAPHQRNCSFTVKRPSRPRAERAPWRGRSALGRWQGADRHDGAQTVNCSRSSRSSSPWPGSCSRRSSISGAAATSTRATSRTSKCRRWPRSAASRLQHLELDPAVQHQERAAPAPRPEGRDRRQRHHVRADRQDRPVRGDCRRSSPPASPPGCRRRPARRASPCRRRSCASSPPGASGGRAPPR